MGHANTPPELPEVTDEAGNTPSWVPMLGATLFLLGIAYVVWSHRGASDTEGPSDPAAELAKPAE